VYVLGPRLARGSSRARSETQTSCPKNPPRLSLKITKSLRPSSSATAHYTLHAANTPKSERTLKASSACGRPVCTRLIRPQSVLCAYWAAAAPAPPPRLELPLPSPLGDAGVARQRGPEEGRGWLRIDYPYALCAAPLPASLLRGLCQWIPSVAEFVILCYGMGGGLIDLWFWAVLMLRCYPVRFGKSFTDIPRTIRLTLIPTHGPRTFDTLEDKR